MKKLVLALTAVAAFTGSAFAADLPARTYTKAPMVAAGSELDRLLHLRRWRRRVLGGRQRHGRHGHRQAALADRSAAWVAAAGTGPSVPATTGKSTRAGSSAFWPTGNSAAFVAIIHDPFVATRRDHESFGQLRGWRPGRLSGCPERSFLRQCRLYRFGVVRLHASSVAAGGAALDRTRPASIVTAGFVGGGVENNLDIFGIICPGWFMKTEYRAAYYGSVTLPETVDRDRFADGDTSDLQAVGTDRSAPRWSTASTGVARWSRSTDLT